MKTLYIVLTIFISLCSINVCGQSQETLSSDILKRRADTLYYNQDYTEALDYYIKTMQVAEKENNDVNYIIAIGYIANIYSNFNDRHSSIYYLKKGYTAAVKAKKQNLQSNFLVNMVSDYCALNDIENAKKYFEKLKSTPSVLDTISWRYFIIYNQARIFNAESDYKSAIKEHMKAMIYAREHNMDSIKVRFQENEIAKNLVLLKDYEKSLKWGELCKKNAEKEHNCELLNNSYHVLYLSYKGLNDEKNYNKYFALYKNMEDSIYNTNTFYESSYKLKEYENKQMESFVSTLKTKTILVILLLLVVIVCITLYLYIQIKKKHNKTAKKNIENVVISEKLTEEIYQKIKELMDDKELIFNPDFSLNELSEKAGSNTKYVSWVINNKYNQNFKSLLNTKRIEEACKMLDDEDIYKNYTIQSVYEKIGYKNATSFIRAFKKIVGMTPIDYKNNKKK